MTREVVAVGAAEQVSESLRALASEVTSAGLAVPSDAYDVLGPLADAAPESDDRGR